MIIYKFVCPHYHYAFFSFLLSVIFLGLFSVCCILYVIQLLLHVVLVCLEYYVSCD